MKKIGLFFLILCVGVIPATARSGDSIILGVTTTLSLLEGKESFEAVRMAVEEINADGGVRVGDRRIAFQVKAFDLGDALPGTAVEDVLSSLDAFIRNEGIHAIVVGPFRSEVLLPAMDIIAANKIPMLGTIAMTPTMDLKILKDPKYQYVFRVGLNSKYLVAHMIHIMKFLHARFGFHRVFIMHQDVAWTRAAASLMIKIFFNRHGWTVLGVDSYGSESSDFSTGLMTAHKRGAEIILPLFDFPQSANLVKQWNEMEIPALLCGFISPMAGPSAWRKFDSKIAGALNVIFELGNVPSRKYFPAKTFYDRFKQIYGRKIEAGHGPAPAYESVYILRDAIQRAGSLDQSKLVSALERTDRQGVMGRIRFNEGHQAFFGTDPAVEALACVIQWEEKGKRKIVHPPSIAEGKIELPRVLRPK